MNNSLYVGVIQTSLNDDAAWVDDMPTNWQHCIRISSSEERRAKKEIRNYFASLRRPDQQPDIVVLPELSVPMGFKRKLLRAAEKLEAIVIAGSTTA